VSATISAISAAHIVFTSGVNIVMYPWDVFEEFWFSRDDATQFASSAHAWARLAGELMLSDMNRFDLERATMGDAS
jgi:inosine-uridine nucleoside N-ribohydrolase